MIAKARNIMLTLGLGPGAGYDMGERRACTSVPGATPG